MIFRAGGPQFGTTVSPSDIAGLTAWWKADTIAQSDGTAVASWADSSSSGFNLSQATGSAQPTYKTTAGPNSTPCVQFDGVNDLLARASVSILSLVSSNQCHIFIVQKQDSTQASNCTINFNGITAPLLNIHLTYSDTLYWDFGNSTAAQGRVNVAQPTGWDNSWRMVQLIRESPNSGTSRIRDQGVEIKTGSVTQTMTAATTTLTIGGGNQLLKGSIAEIIVYNVALGTTDRQSIESYLNGKYAIF